MEKTNANSMAYRARREAAGAAPGGLGGGLDHRRPVRLGLRGGGLRVRAGTAGARERRQHRRGGQRQHGQQCVLAVRRQPRRQRADHDRRAHQRRAGTALHQGQRPGERMALQRRPQIAVRRGEGAAQHALDHQGGGEGADRVGPARQQERRGEPQLRAQQQPFAAEPVGEPPPQRRPDGAEDGGHDVEQTGPAGGAVAQLGQDLGEVRRQAQRGERRHEVAAGHGVHLAAADIRADLGLDGGCVDPWGGGGFHRAHREVPIGIR